MVTNKQNKNLILGLGHYMTVQCFFKFLKKSSACSKTVDNATEAGGGLRIKGYNCNQTIFGDGSCLLSVLIVSEIMACLVLSVRRRAIKLSEGLY